LSKCPRSAERHAGVVGPEGPPKVALDITVRVEDDSLVLWIANPNEFKVEVENRLELYRFDGTWRRVQLGVVFIDGLTVLIPGEMVEQKVPLKPSPGRYRVVKYVRREGLRIKVERDFEIA